MVEKGELVEKVELTISMSKKSFGLIHEELREGTRVELDTDVARNAFQTYLALFRERRYGKQFFTRDSDGNFEEFVITEFEDIDMMVEVKTDGDVKFQHLTLVVSNPDDK